MVELAEREAIRNHRLSKGMAIREDVGGFQQFVMAEPADGAALLVGAEHTLAKAPLVQALTDHRGHVLPPRGQRRRIVELPGGRRSDLVIDRHDKAQGFGMVLDDEHWPRGFVEALDDAVEIDERSLPLHGRSQAHVVAMIRIGAAIAITEEPAVDEPVVVGALFVLDWRRGVDGEGHLGQEGRLENTRRSDQGDPDAFEVEAAFEDGTREGGFAEAAPLVGEEGKGTQSDRGAAVVSHGSHNR